MLQPYLHKNLLECGLDEAGRGCLAGPVFAAAVILPPDFNNELLNDSKQLSESKRYQLRPIIEWQAIAWGVGMVMPDEIDKINILNASFLAMHRALEQLKVQPQHLLVIWLFHQFVYPSKQMLCLRLCGHSPREDA